LKINKFAFLLPHTLISCYANNVKNAIFRAPPLDMGTVCIFYPAISSCRNYRL
jgi:hypothetical protein